VVPAFLTPAYPLPLLVFLVLMSLLLMLLALHSPRQALLGTAVVLAGLPVYSAFQRKGTIRASTADELARDETLKEV
jgi:hypothetical protein